MMVQAVSFMGAPKVKPNKAKKVAKNVAQDAQKAMEAEMKKRMANMGEAAKELPGGLTATNVYGMGEYFGKK